MDTNVVIRGIEGSDGTALDQALAGRTPLVSPQAAAEFGAGGDPAALEAWLAARGGSISGDVDDATVVALREQAAALGRALSPEDARIIGCAQACGTSLMTDDRQIINFMKELGLAVEKFP